MDSREIIILGAGLTGLSCALHLKKDYLIVERENRPGGLCGSISDKNGFIFDYTGHSLHLRDGYAENLVFGLLGENTRKIQRNSWIYTHETYVPFPFQANLYYLPDKMKKECVEKFKSRRDINIDKDKISFHDWVLTALGEGIGKYFMFPYNRKMWNTSLKKLTIDWITPFVPQIKMDEIIKGASEPQSKSYGYNVHFYYPVLGGIQSLIDAITKKINNIKLNTKPVKIDLQKKEISFSDNSKSSFKHIVSTIPLPELLSLIKDIPADVARARNKLMWNSVLCINLGIKKADISDKHWIYFPEKKFIFYRAGFYNNFSKHTVPEGCSSMYLEVSHRPDNKPHPEDTVKKVLDGLYKSKILNRSDNIPIIKLLPIKYAYVIYDKNRTSALKVIEKYLSENGAYSIGRYGAWKYSYMEESILDGKKTAESLNGLVK